MEAQRGMLTFPMGPQPIKCMSGSTTQASSSPLCGFIHSFSQCWKSWLKYRNPKLKLPQKRALFSTPRGFKMTLTFSWLTLESYTYVIGYISVLSSFSIVYINNIYFFSDKSAYASANFIPVTRATKRIHTHTKPTSQIKSTPVYAWVVTISIGKDFQNQTTGARLLKRQHEFYSFFCCIHQFSSYFTYALLRSLPSRKLFYLKYGSYYHSFLRFRHPNKWNFNSA